MIQRLFEAAHAILYALEHIVHPTTVEVEHLSIEADSDGNVWMLGRDGMDHLGTLEDTDE